MFALFAGRSRVAPSQYPRIPFHALRLFQLLASLVVGAVMLYFVGHLTHDHESIPWTFIWLTSASLFSIAALLTTIFLHCLIGLNPRLNLSINGFLAILWGISWGLLTWFASGTLTNYCDAEHWIEDNGIMVCRTFKALFSFALLGFLATIAAVFLDLYVYRQVSRRGIYRLHDLDTKPRLEATRGPFTGGMDDDATEFDNHRISEAWEPPREPFAVLGGTGARPPNGYSVPASQFEYDTEYRGNDGSTKRGRDVI